jgi:hypothetical protein
MILISSRYRLSSEVRAGKEKIDKAEVWSWFD